jgi:hypothetical protein
VRTARITDQEVIADAVNSASVGNQPIRTGTNIREAPRLKSVSRIMVLEAGN